MSLQIIHTRQSHRAALQVSGSDVCLWLSLYISKHRYTWGDCTTCSYHSFQIQVMNVAKQTGTADCALYAMATIASLALGIDPLSVVPNQEELWPHLANTLQVGTVSAFPVIKHQRPASRVAKIVTCLVNWYYRLPDNGETMVCCNHVKIGFILGVYMHQCPHIH